MLTLLVVDTVADRFSICGISNLLLFILLPLHMGQVHQFCFLCCLRKGREMHLLQCFQILDGCAVLCVEFRYFYSVCSFEEFVVLYDKEPK